MIKELPTQFAYLLDEPGPKLLLAALNDHGLQEAPGAANSPRILAMAKNVGAGSYYKNDVTPWCALALADWVVQAGFKPPFDPLAAKSWVNFGMGIPAGQAMLGDVLVMSRAGGGHVTVYVGEDAAFYYGLGGNQGDAVSIARFPKSRITHIRRCPWKVAQPDNVRKIQLTTAAAPVSTKES